MDNKEERMTTFVKIIITGSICIFVSLLIDRQPIRQPARYKRRLRTLQSALCNTKSNTSRKRNTLVSGTRDFLSQIVVLTDERITFNRERVLLDKEVIAVATVDAYLWFRLVYRRDIYEGAM